MSNGTSNSNSNVIPFRPKEKDLTPAEKIERRLGRIEQLLSELKRYDTIHTGENQQ